MDCGDKWLRSFDDNVVPLACRCNWFIVGFKWPLCMAFLTASVKEENDATVWIGLFCVVLFRDGISESVEDLLVAENKADDDEDNFGWSDKSFILENGNQRLGSSVGEVGAKSKNW